MHTLIPLRWWVGIIVITLIPLAAASGQDLVGRWDLTIDTPNHVQLASWLELLQDKGDWKANVVGRWGNSRRLPKVVGKGDVPQFVSPKEEEGSKNDLVFEGKLVGPTLTGSAQGANGESWTWTAKHAPALK